MGISKQAPNAGHEVSRSADGRGYPKYLESYRAYDEQLLPLVARKGSATFDDLSIQIEDPRVRDSLARWLSSARWRGLVVSSDSSARFPRVYRLGPKA
jgi:hypothetical protein